MSEFARKQNGARKTSSLNATMLSRGTPAAAAEAQPTLLLQGTAGKHATVHSTRSFDHDFSRIPVHSFAPAAMQRKLMVNTPGDLFEQEADLVAEQVMRTPEAQLQRTCGCGGRCAECRNEHDQHGHLQTQSSRAVGSQEIVAPPIAQEVLHSSGRPLATAAREIMEERFGHDFSRVRVHADDKAADAARAVHARAYTVGRDIVFGSGEYAPATAEGKRLLAHELTHVVQQRGSELDAPGGMIQRQGGAGKEKAKAPPPWTADELKKMLDGCDGGLGIQAKAKKANGGKSPTIVPGDGSWTDPASGEITIDKTVDKCLAVQHLIAELSNLSRKTDIDTLTTSAQAGDLARGDFIKKIEKIEYETGVINTLTTFDACKKTWKCTTAQMEWARTAKSFDDYFDHFLFTSHKEGYGKWWDDNCKAAYDKEHGKK